MILGPRGKKTQGRGAGRARHRINGWAAGPVRKGGPLGKTEPNRSPGAEKAPSGRRGTCRDARKKGKETRSALPKGARKQQGASHKMERDNEGGKTKKR